MTESVPSLSRGLCALRKAISDGLSFTDTMMTSIGVRVDRGPPRRLSAHDVIFNIGGISNRYDMWRRLMNRSDIAQQIMDHCEFLGSDVHGRSYVPMLDGLGIMLVMNALRGDSARIFRAECTTEFMRYMNGGIINSTSATPVCDTPSDMEPNTTVDPDVSAPPPKCHVGYVYMMKCPSHYDVKIGMTTKSEEDLRKQYARAGYGDELYTDFELFGPCANVRLAEKMVHDELQKFRHSKGREWFLASGDDDLQMFRDAIADAVQSADHGGHVVQGCKKRKFSQITADSEPAEKNVHMYLAEQECANRYRTSMMEANMWDDHAQQMYRIAMDQVLLKMVENL